MTWYILCFLFSLFLTSGCSLLSPTQEVSIRTPAVPEELETLFRGVWTLECCSFSGDVTSGAGFLSRRALAALGQ